MDPSSNHQRYRLLVLGSSQVGKTSLIRQYLHNTFSDRYRETVEDIFSRDFHIQGSILPLDIYDTNYYYPDMRRISIASADAFLLVFAVDDVNSFKSVTELIHEVGERRQADIIDLPIVLVGNKADIADKKIYPETVQIYLKHLNIMKKSIPYYQTSAKMGTNISDIFKSLLDQSGYPNSMKIPIGRHQQRTITSVSQPPPNSFVQKRSPPKRQSSQITVRCLSVGRNERSFEEDENPDQDDQHKSINEKRISRFTRALSIRKEKADVVANGQHTDTEQQLRDKRGTLTRHGSLMRKTPAQRLSLKMKRPTIDEPDDESDCKIS